MSLWQRKILRQGIGFVANCWIIYRRYSSNPFAGKPVKSLPTRQWVAGDYVIRYLIEVEQNLIIVQIWHGREDRPA